MFRYTFVMPRLKEVLAEHQRHRPRHALRDSLGDGFLMEHNPVYRSLREAAVRAGLKFSSRRFHDYDVLPLTQLPRILKSRVIPYRDNVRPLREVERRAPGVFDWDQIPKLRPNHLFHESAHGVARSITKPLLARTAARDQRDHALQLLLEESFANAAESIANAYASTPMHNEFLYKNSYIMEKPVTRDKLRRALERNPFELVFRTLILSFLHANLVRTEDPGRAWASVRSLLAGGHAASLRPVFRIGFDLDPRFTLFTNAFCLRLEGIETELLELVDFDFVRVLREREPFARALDQLARAIRA